MKTLRLNKVENNDSKKLFKQLFDLNIELGKLRDQDSNYKREIKNMINSVDQLMEMILRTESE